LLQALYDEFRDAGLVVLGMNVRDLGDWKIAGKLPRDLGLTFPIVKGPFWGDGRYEASPIPQTYIVDRKRRLVGKRIGGKSWNDPSIRTLITYLLAQEPG